MREQIRRVVTVTGLTAALLLAIPVSSRAADLRELTPFAGLMARTWSWLEGVLGAAPSRPAAGTAKATTTTSTTPAPPPPPSDGGGQGSMIDPDGLARH